MVGGLGQNDLERKRYHTDNEDDGIDFGKIFSVSLERAISALLPTLQYIQNNKNLPFSQHYHGVQNILLGAKSSAFSTAGI